jgi:sec-independent protein translocase protein TatC
LFDLILKKDNNPIMISNETIKNLTEIRTRLIYCLYSYIILFAIFFYSSHSIFNFLSEPLLKFLPQNSSLIATHITSPVIMPITLAMNLSLFANLPIIFYHIWQFIAPGLYSNEKKYIIPLVSSSIILFATGVAFAYYFSLPMMFSLFVTWLPTNVAIMADINNYLEFIFHMFFIFGLVFQVPLVVIILIKLNIISVQQLINIRPYFIIIDFIISMFLTPPDVLSMVILAVPIWILYECGICLGKLTVRSTLTTTPSNISK